MTFHNIFSKKPAKPEKELRIIADNREKSSLLVPELLSKNFKIEFKQLPVADYIINNIAIERKTISDLKSSIINKRIFQQLMELKQYKQYLLVIEGLEDPEFNQGIIHENAFRGFLLSVIMENQIPILFTQNAKDTAKYFCILTKEKDKKELSLRPSKIFRSQKQQACYILEGFPNIGPVKTKALLTKFSSLKNIFNAEEEELQPILRKQSKDFKSIIEKEHK